MIKNLPAKMETPAQSMGGEDPLEKEMETHSSILAWRIPWTEEPGRLQSTELQRVGHNLATECFSLALSPSFPISSVQFSCSVMSYSLQPHELQYTRPPCPSPTPEVYSNSCPLSRCAIQPSHPLSFPSPPAPNPSQHQGLFQ